ncbi:MAG: S9 family peptidase [Candidatus Dormibacteraeota bacterium]|nr:S9 family peptidase [Candidatus Dormibacteraeota bacterium]
MPAAPWRRRFRAAQLGFPIWARDAPGRLLYSSNQTGRFELFTWDLAGGSRRQVTDRPEGTTRGTLDPAGERVWWFDDDRGSEHGIWMSEPFAGGEPPAPAVAGLEPAYSAGLALARTFAVVGSSTDEGVRVRLASHRSAPLTLYQHHEHADLGDLSRDEGLLALEHSEHGDHRHPALRILDLAGDRVAELWDGPGLGLAAGPWSPIPGDQRLLVVHERTGMERPAVWSPLTGELQDLVLDLSGEVTADWYPDGSALLLHHAHAGRGELYAYQLDSCRLRRLEIPAGTVRARVRPDGRLWYRHSSGARPPTLLDAGGKEVLSPPGEPTPGGRPYEELQVGRVHGFLAEPAGPPPHPTVMLVHGGPEAHDQDAFSARVQAWVDHGFAVAMVNYRGSTGYGREWRDALAANPGLTELEDVTAVRDHLVAAGIADPRRLVLAGASWGGYLTLLGLGRQAEAWSLGIAMVPVADYAAAFEDEMEPLKAYDRALFGGTPAERPEFYRERSPITFVERVSVPVLITAGRNDPRCPLRQIENYVARLRGLNKTHQVYEYDAGHGSMVADEQIRQMELQLSFCHEHLGTPSPLD